MILHVDMDAFYTSVEQRDRPELRGKPVIVGGTPAGRGVVAAASYEARKFGVHSAMPAVTAKRLCPQAIVLPTRIRYYASVSAEINEIFNRFTPLVEPLSLDEAFLDVRGSERLFGSALDIGRSIKQEIGDRLQLVASVGVAANKFLAKIASDLEKPDGFVIVDPSRTQVFLDPLPVGRLWGVGRATGRVFQRLGVQTVADVRALPRATLERYFGEQGSHLWELSRGIDARRVVPDREAKSISHETTFPVDIDDREVLRGWLVHLTEQVACRLRHHRLRGRTVQLKVRFSDFRTITRSTTFPRSTDVTDELWQAASEMFDHRLPAVRQPVRLLGLGVSGLESPAQVQRLLFGVDKQQAHASLDKATDQIREKFGTSSLARASGLRRTDRQEPSKDTEK